MPKGFYSQSVCLLTEGHAAIDDVRGALSAAGFQIVKQVPPSDDWRFGGLCLIISFCPEVNGYIAVDIADHAWPDEMGDPKSDSPTFGAWAMGQFGPFVFPGGLKRAGKHAWAWAPGKAVANRHRGFIRVRSSYIFGCGDNMTVLPKGYDPLAELNFLSRIVLALFAVPGVTCYFNPNGEVLLDRGSFGEAWNACAELGKIPLSLWMNIRLFNLSDTLGMMDTVGNGQMGVADVEAIYPKSRYEPRDVDYYLRNVTHYLFDAGKRIKNGDPIDGPGESDLSWTAEWHENGLVQPPRDVLRLYPTDNANEINTAIAKIPGESR